MTIRQARFIARKIKAFYENNCAWWETEDLPAVEDLAKEIRKDPAGIDEIIVREYQQFDNELCESQRDAIRDIHLCLNHPELLDFDVYYGGKKL